MENQLVEELKELINCYDICKNENSAVNQEIRMWRNAFLISNFKGKEIDTTTLAQNYFMNIPSDKFMLKDPREFWEECKKPLNKKDKND